VPFIIVSADSRQIFRGFDIGTDKVSLAVRTALPHLGLDVATADQPYTLFDWLSAVRAGLSGATGIGIVVGGTGLYQRGLLRGYLPGGARPTDPAVRKDLEEEISAAGRAPLEARLAALNPAAAHAVSAASSRRLIRALEIATLGGDPTVEDGTPWPAQTRMLLLDQPNHAAHRTTLAERIDRQFDGGLIDEAIALAAHLPVETPALSGIGYREALQLARGEIDDSRARAETLSRTWAYARRQRTWYRAEPITAMLEAGSSTLAAELLVHARALLDAAA